MIKRRTFLTGLVSLLAAPAVVKAQSLMPIRGIILPPHWMTVILDGYGPFRSVTFSDPQCHHIRLEAKADPQRCWLDVPWLGSQQKSMDYYNAEVIKLKPLFSTVNSISWGDSAPPWPNTKPYGVPVSNRMVDDSLPRNDATAHLTKEWLIDPASNNTVYRPWNRPHDEDDMVQFNNPAECIGETV